MFLLKRLLLIHLAFVATAFAVNNPATCVEDTIYLLTGKRFKKVTSNKNLDTSLSGTALGSLNQQVDLLTKEAAMIAKEIRALLNPDAQYILAKFPKDLITRHNQNLESFQKLLSAQGVETRTLLSKWHPDFHNLEIVNVQKSSTGPFKLYVRAHKKFLGNELIISNFENAITDSYAKYTSKTNTTDLGMHTLNSGLKNKYHLHGLHELRHLLKTKHQEQTTDKFSPQFFASAKKNLAGDNDVLDESDYLQYLHAQEIYTMSSDLRVLGAMLTQDLNPALIPDIKSNLDRLSRISSRIFNLTHGFKKPQKVVFSDEDTIKTISFYDKYDRRVQLKLTSDERQVHDKLNMEKLLNMLDPTANAQFKNKVMLSRTEPFPSRVLAELIRSTLQNHVLIPKFLNHIQELQDISEAQMKLAKEAADLIDTAEFGAADLARILHKIAKNVR